MPRARSTCPAKPERPCFTPSTKMRSFSAYWRTLNWHAEHVEVIVHARLNDPFPHRPSRRNNSWACPCMVQTPTIPGRRMEPGARQAVMKKGSPYPRPTVISPSFRVPAQPHPARFIKQVFEQREIADVGVHHLVELARRRCWPGPCSHGNAKLPQLRRTSGASLRKTPGVCLGLQSPGKAPQN